MPGATHDTTFKQSNRSIAGAASLAIQSLVAPRVIGEMSDSGGDPLPPKSLYPKVRHLNGMLDTLWLLPSEPTEPDSIPATRWAIRHTNKLLNEACEAIVGLGWLEAKIEFPLGYLMSDDEGGVRVEWGHAGERSVRLAVAANAEKLTYLFFESGGNSRLIKSPTAVDLARTLKSIIG